MIDAHSLLAILQPLDLTLDVVSASITLRESRAPYGEVVLECQLPTGADRTAIDLRTGDLTLDLRLRRDFGRAWSLADLTAAGVDTVDVLTGILDGDPLGFVSNLFYRPWNSALVLASQRRDSTFLVTEREFDDRTKRLILTAHTRDALLIGDALLETVPLDPSSTDLRTICASVIARYGDTLAAGGADATVAETEATIWRPGVTAFDYLDPMLEAASLRLWCDDSGIWQLTERQSTVEGSVSIAATGSMTDHRDRMTRTDTEIWFDGVAIVYQWVDDLGANQVAYDTAPADTVVSSVKTIERNTPYPGPGAAAGILSRAEGRGRALTVEAVSNYTVTPGQSITLTPPDTPIQTGFLAGVSWRYPEGTMSVETRGLVDTPETAWYSIEAGFKWTDFAIGETWAEIGA